jgi:hypothetical protein
VLVTWSEIWWHLRFYRSDRSRKWPMGLKMKEGRETQAPHESCSSSIYRHLKLIRFQASPLKMRFNCWYRAHFQPQFFSRFFSFLFSVGRARGEYGLTLRSYPIAEIPARQPWATGLFLSRRPVRTWRGRSTFRPARRLRDAGSASGWDVGCNCVSWRTVPRSASTRARRVPSSSQ